MEDSGARLKEAREAAGFKSASQAAKKFPWESSSTYRSHENGQTPVPVEAAEHYARVFKVRAAWLLTGEGPRNATGRASEDADSQDKYEEAEPVVIRVGARVLYVDEKLPAAQLLGQECAVKLPDGRMLVRFLKPGSTKRVFDLEAKGTQTLKDQRIEWAAPVRGR